MFRHKTFVPVFNCLFNKDRLFKEAQTTLHWSFRVWLPVFSDLYRYLWLQESILNVSCIFNKVFNANFCSTHIWIHCQFGWFQYELIRKEMWWQNVLCLFVKVQWIAHILLYSSAAYPQTSVLLWTFRSKPLHKVTGPNTGWQETDEQFKYDLDISSHTWRHTPP